MARSRLLKPDFFNNEYLGELSFETRLLFAGLWTLADREGRLEDRPKRIKVDVFPWDDVDVEAMLNDLDSGGFIVRYVVDGCRYICIPKFLKHQTPHVREAASTLPEPPEGVMHRSLERATAGVYAVRVGDFVKIGYGGFLESRLSTILQQHPTSEAVWTIERLLPSDAARIEKLLHRRFALQRSQGEWFYASSEILARPDAEELLSTVRGTAPALPRSPVSVSVPVLVSDPVLRDSSEPPTAASEPVMEFPCVGKQQSWTLTAEQIREWLAAFPDTDVLAECRKARAWILATPGRRKTAGGMPRFLVGWLGRTVDSRSGADRRQQPRGAADRRSGWEPFVCPHTPECHGRSACDLRTKLDEMKASA